MLTEPTIPIELNTYSERSEARDHARGSNHPPCYGAPIWLKRLIWLYPYLFFFDCRWYMKENKAYRLCVPIHTHQKKRKEKWRFQGNYELLWCAVTKLHSKPCRKPYWSLRRYGRGLAGAEYISHRGFLGWTFDLWCSFMPWSLPVLEHFKFWKSEMVKRLSSIVSLYGERKQEGP